MNLLDLHQRTLTSAVINQCKYELDGNKGGGDFYLSTRAYEFLASQGYAVKQYGITEECGPALKEFLRLTSVSIETKDGDKWQDGDWVYHLQDKWPDDVIFITNQKDSMMVTNVSLNGI